MDEATSTAVVPVEANLAPHVSIDPTVLAKEPKFVCCWADEDREICEVVLGTTTFRMRSLTAGEANKISGLVEVRLPKHSGEPSHDHKVLYARVLGKEPEECGPEDLELLKNLLKGDHAGMNGSAIIRYTVAAALGLWSKYGTEGWNDPNWGVPREVSLEQIDRMKDEALAELWRKHNKFFRTE